MNAFIKPPAYKNINSSDIKIINNPKNEAYYQYYYNKVWNIISLKFLWS